MKVTLIDHTANPEKMIAIAARMCYSSLTASEMIKGLTEETVDHMISVMEDTGHSSLIEHINFTFIIEGVSRVLSHQLVRHRMTSPHQRSQRYVKKSLADEVITPPSIKETPGALEVFQHAVDVTNEAYQKMLELGVPKDDARFIFPNATGTQLILTLNGRSLVHLLSLRCCNRASWEIRNMAKLMLQECRKVSPKLFNNVGPSCYTNHGLCPEGKMCCGHTKEVCEHFAPENFNQWMEETHVKND